MPVPLAPVRTLLIMSLARRRLLTLLAAGGVGTLAGCTGGSPIGPPSEKSSCVARVSLDAHDAIGSGGLVYDISGEPMDFWFDAGFYGQLERWLDLLTQESGLDPDQIWTFGSWIDGGSECDSWHDSGRAFDLARLQRGGDVQMSCRYDIWKTYDGERQDFFRRRYWGVAASLHHEFAYVLTYVYNEQHENHIHIDTGRSGSDRSTFSPRSSAQVQAVQAICRHLWDGDVEITGRFDRATRRAANAVLDQLELGGDLDDGDEQWRGFLLGSVRRGFAER